MGNKLTTSLLWGMCSTAVLLLPPTKAWVENKFEIKTSLFLINTQNSIKGSYEASSSLKDKKAALKYEKRSLNFYFRWSIFVSRLFQSQYWKALSCEPKFTLLLLTWRQLATTERQWSNGLITPLLRRRPGFDSHRRQKQKKLCNKIQIVFSHSRHKVVGPKKMEPVTIICVI